MRLERDLNVAGILGIPTKVRKPRRSPEEIAAEAMRKAIEAADRVALLKAEEAAKTNPTVQSLLLAIAKLKVAKREATVAKDGYTNGKTGEKVIPSLAEKIDNLRAKLASMEARLSVIDTLPGEIDGSIAYAKELISAAVKGEPVDFPSDLIPAALRTDPDFAMSAEDRAGMEFHGVDSE